MGFMMGFIIRFMLGGGLYFLIGSTVIAAAPIEVHNLRLWSSPESTRIVLDLSHAVHYKTVSLSNPDRLIIDLDQAYCSGNIEKLKLAHTGIVKITRQNKQKQCQITLELDKARSFEIFMLKPNESYGYRLVIDLAKRPIHFNEPANEPIKGCRDFLVAIDAGHGGEDPGAVGLLLGTQEKDVVLSVAKKLAKLINQERGMQAILIREGDYYLGLRKRVNLARKHHADVFLSIHADSFSNSRAHGASAFVLSQKSASSEAARWLAEHENRSDLIGGVRLEDKSNILASVLLDLSQSVNRESSEDLANVLLSNLSEIGPLHHRQVQRAGFMVLKSPDIPSVLVELGFLSHPKEEEKLREIDHQNCLARALFKGIKQFLAQQPSPMHHVMR